MAEVLAVSSAIASLVTLVGQVSRLSYGFFLDVKHASKTQKAFLRETSALTEVFLRMEEALDVEEIPPLRPSSVLSDTLEECKDLLRSLKASLEKVTESESRVARIRSSIRWPLSEKQLMVIEETLLPPHWPLTPYKSRERIIQWLDNPRPPRSFPVLYESACPSTGQWLLSHEEYLDWRDGDTPLLWCYGHPGVGKTIISAIILHDLHQLSQKTPGSQVLCQFCDVTQPKSVTVLQSLLRQVLNKGDSSQLSILEHYSKDSNTPSLIELTRTLSKVSEVDYNTYLIIDALDEYRDQKALIAVIRALIKAEVKVLVTSRDVPNIRDAFRSEKSLEIQAPRADLEVYIENRLTESDLYDSLNESSGIVSTIIDQADGLSLLARLLVEHFLSCTNVKQAMLALKSMPSNLADAYQSTFERMKAQSPNRANLAFRVIGWVTHAERRLGIEELRHAIAVEESSSSVDDENLTSRKIILQVCIGLLSIDPEDNTINMIHHTAYEYFRQLEGKTRNIQFDMAKTCLTYLNQRPMHQGPCGSVKELQRRFDGMAFLAYAAQHWGDHACQAENKMSTRITQLLNDEALRSSSFQALQHREFCDANVAAAVFESLPKDLSPLHIAAYWNLKNTGEVLLKDGADPNLLDGQTWTPLHWACFRGSADVMRALLEHGADINARDLSGWTPLFWAAIKGHEENVSRLLQDKAEHLLTDKSGWTALHWSVSKGSASISKLLLDHHASYKATQRSTKIWIRDVTVEGARMASQSWINASLDNTKASTTVLEIAAEHEDVSTFDTIIEDLATRGSSQDFNKLWAQKGWDKPLASTAWRIFSKSDMMDRKGLQRWDIDAKTASSVSWKTKLLHGAIRDGKVPILRLLLELEADLEIPYERWTLLQQAAAKEDPEIVNILLAGRSHVRDLPGDDYEGQPPLHIAVAKGFERTVEALARGGCSINGKNQSGETALMLACTLRQDEEGHTSKSLSEAIVKLLIEYGADVSAVDRQGQSALHYAVANTDPDVQTINLLLERGIDVTTTRKDGLAPFHVFCRGSNSQRTKFDQRQKDVFQLLLSSSPSGTESLECEKKDWAGAVTKETPLALALEGENWPIFHLLLEKEAKLRTTCSLDRLLHHSAWSWALQPKAVRLLLDSGASATFQAYGQTPLGHAALEGLLAERFISSTAFQDFRAILDMYVEGGLDLTATDSSGKSLLYTAMATAQDKHEPALTQHLLNLGADPYQPLHGAWDAFLLAAIHGHYQALRVLVSHASEKPNADHWLHLSKNIGPLEAFDQADADLIWVSLLHAHLLESPDESGLTPLQKVVSLKKTSTASALLATKI